MAMTDAEYYLRALTEIRKTRARRREEARVLDVIRRGAEDDEPPPDESLLGAHFFEPFAVAR